MKCQKCGKETDKLYMTSFGDYCEDYYEDYCEDCVMEKYGREELDKIFIKTGWEERRGGAGTEKGKVLS